MKCQCHQNEHKLKKKKERKTKKLHYDLFIAVTQRIIIIKNDDDEENTFIFRFSTEIKKKSHSINLSIEFN